MVDQFNCPNWYWSELMTCNTSRRRSQHNTYLTHHVTHGWLWGGTTQSLVDLPLTALTAALGHPPRPSPAWPRRFFTAPLLLPCCALHFFSRSVVTIALPPSLLLAVMMHAWGPLCQRRLAVLIRAWGPLCQRRLLSSEGKKCVPHKGMSAFPITVYFLTWEGKSVFPTTVFILTSEEKSAFPTTVFILTREETSAFPPHAHTLISNLWPTELLNIYHFNLLIKFICTGNNWK